MIASSPTRTTTRRWPVWLLAGALIGTLFQVANHAFDWIPTSEFDLGQVSLFLVGIAFVAMGAVILRNLPRHRIAWVFVITGYSLILSGATQLISYNGSLAGDAFAGALWLSWITLGGFVILWFPTGRVPNQRWRLVQWLGFGVLSLSVSYVVAGQLCAEYNSNEYSNEYGGCARFVDNPIGVSWVPNPEFGPASGMLFIFMFVFLVLSAAALIVRYVRSEGIERRQLKWFAYAVALSLIFDIVGFSGAADALPSPVGDFLFAIQGVIKLGVPVAAAVAILRYRLFEIDRIVSRTVGYAVVLGVLGLFYVVGAVWLPSQMAGDSPAFVAGSTLAVAALFNPLRRRVLNIVDRRFYRAKFDADRILSEFSDRLRNQSDMGRLAEDWAVVVAETMRPTSLGVWVKQP